MKKILKILGMIACAFVIVLSGVLTACGGGAYSVKGKMLKGSSECFIVWGENATQEEKEEFWSQLEAKNDEEFAQNYSEATGGFYETWSYTFNKDGTFSITLTEKTEPETITGYYVQSEDLKNVKTYSDAEFTDLMLEYTLEYVNGNFCLNLAVDSDYDVGIYFVFNKA